MEQDLPTCERKQCDGYAIRIIGWQLSMSHTGPGTLYVSMPDHLKFVQPRQRLGNRDPYYKCIVD